MTSIGTQPTAYVAPHVDTFDLTGFIIERPAWQAHGACIGADQDLFFTERGDSTREAKAICASCTVINDCLECALDRPEHFGIWGGASERTRIRMRRERNQKVA